MATSISVYICTVHDLLACFTLHFISMIIIFIYSCSIQVDDFSGFCVFNDIKYGSLLLQGDSLGRWALLRLCVYSCLYICRQVFLLHMYNDLIKATFSIDSHAGCIVTTLYRPVNGIH